MGLARTEDASRWILKDSGGFWEKHLVRGMGEQLQGGLPAGQGQPGQKEVQVEACGQALNYSALVPFLPHR